MKTFRDQSIEYMREIITEWENIKEFPNQFKRIIGSVHSPIVQDELLIRFENEITQAKCNGIPLELKMQSKLFFTTSLSKNPLGKNYKADGYRLKKHLEYFDLCFSEFISHEIDKCLEGITYNSLIF